MQWLFSQPLDSVLSSRIILIVTMTGVASAALSALAMMTVGGGKYAGLGSIAVPLAFLAGYVFFLGVPPSWSPNPLHILPYIVLIGVIAGLAIDVVSHVERVRLAVVLAWPAIVVVGIGWHEMPDFATIAGLPMALLWLSGVLGYLWMGSQHRFPTTPVVCLLAIAIGQMLLAVVGDSKILTVLNAIYAAALIGFFALNWPQPRFPLLATGNFGVAGIALALAVTEALYSNTPPEAIAVLLLVFIMPPIAGLLPLGKGAKTGPFILLLTCLLPVIGALWFASYITG